MERATLCARMQAWVEAHPREPDAGRGLIWMAHLQLIDGQREAARQSYARAASGFAGSEWGLRGEEGLATLEAGEHDFSASLARWRQLAALPDPYWQEVAGLALRQVEGDQRRWWGAQVVAAALLLLVGLSLRGQRTVPEEAWHGLPGALLVFVGGLTRRGGERQALVVLALGGLLLLAASGARLARARLDRRRRALEVLLGLGSTLGLLYVAVVTSDLWSRFAETLQEGAER